MPNPSATPTPVTPPRVPLIDSRTGFIDRAWYMFFVSLFNASQNNDGWQKGADVNSLLASYDAASQALAQAAEAQPSNSALANEIAELQKQVEGLQMTPPPREFKRSRYGAFLDTTTQAAGTINTATAITFNTTDLSQGVYLGTPTSRVYVDRVGAYNFQFSLQLVSSNANEHLTYVWPRINGVDVTQSATKVSLKGNSVVAAWNFVLKMNTGDYFELMWATDSTDVSIQADPATAFCPAIPSAILTVSCNIGE